MARVAPKKHLGQHFLNDDNIARNIAESLTGNGYKTALEIGPGMGVLTQFLLQDNRFETWCIEIDTESVTYLKEHYPQLGERLLSSDFLKLDLQTVFAGPFAIVGNFPYNISSQIVFKMLDNRAQVPELVGMFQKEVAERFNAKPRTKAYGILSVLLQTYYNTEYLFTVHEHVFTPPPKVKSGVVRIVRNERQQLECNEKLYKEVIKTAFNQRRKTLRNSLKKFNIPDEVLTSANFAKLRPEELTVADFINLTLLVQAHKPV
jgi:16S rRNA (adenine1518-N6/adenine1519-N6)-dimethyltransferase